MKVTINRKRYPHGKYFINTQGDPDYKDVAEQAFIAAVVVTPQLNREIFVNLMRKNNVPDNAIEEYLSNVTLENETFSEDHPELELLTGYQSTFTVSGPKGV